PLHADHAQRQCGGGGETPVAPLALARCEPQRRRQRGGGLLLLLLTQRFQRAGEAPLFRARGAGGDVLDALPHRIRRQLAVHPVPDRLRLQVGGRTGLVEGGGEGLAQARQLLVVHRRHRETPFASRHPRRSAIPRYTRFSAFFVVQPSSLPTSGTLCPCRFSVTASWRGLTSRPRQSRIARPASRAVAFLSGSGLSATGS